MTVNNTIIKGGNGFDFEDLGYTVNNVINDYYHEAEQYALNTIIPELEKKSIGLRFVGDTKLVIFPNRTYYGNIQQTFSNCSNLELFPDEFDCPKLRTLTSAFERCSSLRKIPYIDLNKIGSNITLLSTFAYAGTRFGIDASALSKWDFEKVVRLHGTFEQCPIKILPPLKNTHNIVEINYVAFYKINLAEVQYFDIFSLSAEITSTAFGNSLEKAKFDRWKLCNINFAGYSKFDIESINYLIENALGEDDGAIARQIILNSAAKTNWMDVEQNPDYEYYAAMAVEKLITIASA